MPQVENRQRTGTGNILIVDDDPDTCQMLVALFGTRGYDTTIVYSGQDALNRVEVEEPDVVVLDVMMPGMDGWETCHRLRSKSDVPILFLSALGSEGHAVRALTIGGNDYVRKPFHAEELLARIGVLLRDGHMLSSQTPIGDLTWEVKVKQPRVSVVIPAYNEEAGLPLVLQALFGVLNDTYEILVVDDGSSDGTAVIAKDFPCRLIRHSHNMGKGAAIRTGLQHARGGKVVFLDADNTYPVEAVPALAQLLDEYELVRGVRLSGRLHIPRLNRLGNRLFDGMIRVLHAVEGGDVLSGMYGGRRDCLLELDLESEGFDIEAEISVKSQAHGLKYATLPITYNSRVGEKKLNAFQDGFRILYRVAQLSVAYSPLQTFILPGLVMLVAGIAGLGLMFVEPFRFIDLPFAANGTFLLGIIGSLGTQLVIFGIAVYTAGMTYGFRGRANRTLDRASHYLSTRASILVGLVLGIIGILGVIWLGIGWLIHGMGSFKNTEILVLMSFSMMFGFQLLSSGVFLSALRGLRRAIPRGAM